MRKLSSAFDEGLLGQCALAHDVSRAEVCFCYRYAYLFITFPQHVGPVACSGVERAAIVEYQGLYSFELHTGVVIFLLPTFTSDTPMTIHTSSRMRVKKLA